MKRILTAIAIVLIISGISCAETITPQETVRLLIQSAQQNNLQNFLSVADLLKIATHPRHAKDPKSLITFLRTIDIKKLEFQQIKIGPLPTETTVRIIAPISYDFDVILIKATKDNQEDHYVVIGIHP